MIELWSPLPLAERVPELLVSMSQPSRLASSLWLTSSLYKLERAFTSEHAVLHKLMDLLFFRSHIAYWERDRVE